VLHPVLLGMALGLRHASEPDHLAAIANLVGARRGALAAAWTGACWGAGHGLALVALGGTLIATGLRLPPRVSLALDLAVAVMLVALGIGSIRSANAEAADGARAARRSLVVGFIHGASGTAGLTLMYLASLPSRGTAFAFLLTFALGALVAMAAVSTALSRPMAAFAARTGRGERRLRIGGALLAFGAAAWVCVDALKAG
jgi:nickel/cobalt exporter